MVSLRLKCVSIAAMVAVAVIVSGQAVLAADPQAGQSVYQKNACNACHGAKGEGGAGPALSGAAFAGKYASADALADVIRKGTAKGMPPYAEDKIAKADLENLVAFIQGMTIAAAPKVDAAAPKAETAAPKPAAEAKASTADPKAGQPVYEKNGCSACHGAKGEGAVGPALSGAAFTGKYATADALTDVIRKGTSKGMPPYAEDKIANADMINMVAYIQGFAAAGAAAPKAAAAAPNAQTAAKSEPAKAAVVDKSAEKPAEATQAGMTLEQAYVIVIAVLGVLLMLVFVIVLNGPLKVSNR